MFMVYPDIIILAGGLGTRLRGEINNLPKAMAPVNGRPFLEYLLNYLNHAGFKRVILSTGFLSSVIENHFRSRYKSLDIFYAIEKEPLGTGGGIKLAVKKVQSPYFIVLNGDTFFPIDIQGFFQKHVEQLADLSIALKEVDDASRYGEVVCNEHGMIKGFQEKSAEAHPGLINGGIYIVKTKYFKNLHFPEKFSFEKDFLQPVVSTSDFYGQVFEDYFLDIGVPDDYKRAQIELNAFND